MKAVLVVDVEDEKLAEFFDNLATVIALLKESGKVQFSTPDTLIVGNDAIGTKPSVSPQELKELEKLEAEIRETSGGERDFLRTQAKKLADQRQARQAMDAAVLQSTDPNRPADAEVGGLASLQSKIGKIPHKEKAK